MSSEVVVAEPEAFIDRYLPFALSPVAVTRAIEELVRAKLLDETGSKWPSFPIERNDDTIAYSKLSSIFEVLERSIIGPRPAFKYITKPHHRTAAEIPGATHKIDGLLIPTRSTVPGAHHTHLTPTSDTAVNFEFKRAMTDDEIIKVS
jgi:hypothetical protein